MVLPRSVAPQFEVKVDAFGITLAGIGSSKTTPLSWDALGLVIVIIRTDNPLLAKIIGGVKDLFRIAGLRRATVKIAVAVLPSPPFVDFT